jgi:hypothetical protein
MTKWVTLILLTLALLVFGVSRMRPQPALPAPSSSPLESHQSTTKSPSPEPPSTSDAQPLKRGDRQVSSPQFASSAGKNSARSTTSDQRTSRPRPVTGRVKAAVLSTTAGGPSRTRFPSTTEHIFVTATPEGMKDEIEITARFRSVMNDEAKFSPPVESSGPSRRRLFRLTRPKKGWVKGPYQLVFNPKGGDQMLGFVRFEVGESAASESIPEPEYLDLVSDISSEAKSSFPSGLPELFLRVSAQKLPAGKSIRTVWSAVEVDRLTAGELIAVANQPAPGEGQDALFTFSAPPGGFHPGSYKVEVYFDQVKVGNQAFFLQPTGSK